MSSLPRAGVCVCFISPLYHWPLNLRSRKSCRGFLAAIADQGIDGPWGTRACKVNVVMGTQGLEQGRRSCGGGSRNPEWETRLLFEEVVYAYVCGVADGGERCREKISRLWDGKRDALGPSWGRAVNLNDPLSSTRRSAFSWNLNKTRWKTRDKPRPEITEIGQRVLWYE